MKPRITKAKAPSYAPNTYIIQPWCVETDQQTVRFTTWASALRWARWYCDVNAGVI